MKLLGMLFSPITEYPGLLWLKTEVQPNEVCKPRSLMLIGSFVLGS